MGNRQQVQTFLPYADFRRSAEALDWRRLGKQGVDVVRPTVAQRVALRTAAEPVWTKWTAAIGPDLVETAQAAVKR